VQQRPSRRGVPDNLAGRIEDVDRSRVVGDRQEPAERLQRQSDRPAHQRALPQDRQFRSHQPDAGAFADGRHGAAVIGADGGGERGGARLAEDHLAEAVEPNEVVVGVEDEEQARLPGQAQADGQSR
jgi:hypothetical protein